MHVFPGRSRCRPIAQTRPKSGGHYAAHLKRLRLCGVKYAPRDFLSQRSPYRVDGYLPQILAHRGEDWLESPAANQKMAPNWTWDELRSAYFCYSEEEGCFVYQDGTRLARVQSTPAV